MSRTPQSALHLYLDEEKKNPKHIGKPYGMFEKHDGWYGYIDFPSCVINSRKCREIPSLVELSNLIRTKRPNIKGRLIFEIMIDGLEINSFHTLNGILNRKYEQAEGAYLRVHDFIPQWREDVPFRVRWNLAQQIVQSINLPEVKLSRLLGISSEPTEWRRICGKLWKQQREGIILKHIEGNYAFGKRNADILKIKEEVTVDLLIVDLIEGEGKYHGTLGALLCKDKAGNLHKMSGMSDTERDEWWDNPDHILKRVVEGKAMKRLPDGQFRELRYKAIRWDKAPSEID